ncbi:sigma-70 RNA polymerase sigma factor region 4 domain-containing protein [Oceanobacillus profundus]|uniref:Sigma-70 family RNA polymerase sigma factor n=1 Tax=Oceanobacillus profundus TaxID=372463 RepID=A0A417YGG1_9BACI|nr:sigma-70 family RNA polymerase sigma factor [Oceanobacillus profundus]RHW31907.1 sigma-70 family RNA polymerase sigma factor [Oceanobacillus profundus]
MSNQYINPWTEEANEELLFLVGRVKTIKAIAKRLNRTPGSVQRQLERLGATKHIETGMFSANELAKTLHVDTSTIIRHIHEKGLPGEKLYFKGNNSKNQPYYIDVKRFWNWASNNRDLYIWSRIERRVLNPEPEWLDEQISIDVQLPSNKGKYWTPAKDTKLWNMYYNQNMKQKDIANILNRSVNSIEKRLKRLRDTKFSLNA